MYPEQYDNAQEAFEDLFNRIMRYGKDKNGTKYVRNISFELMQPQENKIDTPWRKWSHGYAELEWEWYMSGEREPTMVENRAKLWKTMKDDQGKVWSNYGWWWKLSNQLGQVTDLLRQDLSTRRAIITHYAPGNLQMYKQDTPCNLILNFHADRVGDMHYLNMTAFARSIDLVFGFCNDQYCFSKLLMKVQEQLGVKLGTLTYMITDLHIYEKDWNRRSNINN